MKSGRYLLLILFIFTSLTTFAQGQQNVEVTGTVVEEGTKTPIEQATIRLLNLRDSTFIGGVASERRGTFTLKNIKPGDYLLHISFIGFEPLYQPVQITGRTNPIKLGNLGLSDGSIMLNEAVAVGKAAEVVVRNDTIEYNADSYKVTEGSTLEDLLKKMPGVEVDDEGKVTVNGKEVKKVLVDGKEFFSDDPKVATKNLPSNMVDKVQVLDRLSEMAQMTGFDDGDEETVINLTVKQGMKQGWFGNAFAGYGSKERYEGNAMVNRFINNDQITFMGGINNTNNMGMSDMASSMFSGMGGGGRGGFGYGGGRNGITTSGNAGMNFSKEFNKKLTFGGNARYGHSDNETLSNSRIEDIMPSGSTYSFEDARTNRLSDNIGANFRLDWKPDSMTTIIFRPNISYSKSENREGSLSHMLNSALDTAYYGTADSYSKGEGFNLSGRLEFSRKLNGDGRILSGSINGGMSDTYSNQDSKSSTFYTDGTDRIIDQKIRNENNGFNYQAYLSWVEPIGRNNFIQLTYSISQRKQEQLKNAFNQDANGNYNVIDTLQTRNMRNNYVNQRASLSFKSVRAKFNYTIGFNVDPSYSRNEQFIGDSILSNITQKVVNFSPTAQFRFNFNRQSNLRIDYSGRTSQPSMTQMQPVPDYSNPNNIIIGNPDLKPRYNNNMFIRYQSFKPESQMAFMVMANGGYTVNDIVSYVITENADRKTRSTTYENMNGNYNGNVRVMFNTPLKNKKFTVSSMTMASYANSSAYVGERDSVTQIATKEKSNSKNLILMERASFDYRSNYFDLGINGSISYNKANYTLEPDQNQNTYTYSVGGRTTIYLPGEFKLESDISWNKNSGYATGYELDEVLWNASASKSFLKGNAATIRFKIYDILQQRSNISQSITALRNSFTQYNTINSYFMVHFIYRFSIFSGGASMQDTFGGRRGGPGGPPPGGGRPGGGFGG